MPFTCMLYNIHSCSLSIFLLTKLFATNGHKMFSTDALSMAKQSHYQNNYYWMHNRNIGKLYTVEMLKSTPTIDIGICYYINQLSSFLQA